MTPVELPAWALVRDARRRAGISQQELASRAGTSQSAVARYERARSTPDLATLHRLVEACGFQLRYELVPVDDGERQVLDAMLELTAADRLEQNRTMTALGAAASTARAEGRIRPLRPS